MLVVDRIFCEEESDEIASDDIYLIMFTGITRPPFNSELNSIGPSSAWQDFDTGQARNLDVGVAITDPDAVYVAMLVEEDASKDVAGDAVIGAWRTQTDLVWRSIMLGSLAGGNPTTSEASKKMGFAGIRNALNGLASIYMEFPKGDDDVIGTERVTITEFGQSQTVRFRSPSDQEDATYHVTFKHERGPHWSGWERLGGVLASAPAASSWSANRLDIFARGSDNRLKHKWWDGNQWQGWEDLGGRLTAAPAAVSWGPNRIDCFVRGSDNQLWHKWWDGNQWQRWEDLGGELASAPAASSWSANRLDIFARGSDNRLKHKWWDGNQWQGWEDLGGRLTAAPAAVSWGPNRIDCFVRGSDNQLWHKWWDGNQWQRWEDLGGELASAPAASSWSANRLDIFARGSDNRLKHKWWDGNQWQGWEDLGGRLTAAPAAVSWGPNRIDCFVRGSDNQLWHKWWDGNQ